MPQSPSLPQSNGIAQRSVNGTSVEAMPADPPFSGEAGGVVHADSPALDDDWPTLAVLSRRYIDRALEHTHGNKTRAADLLGIDRRTLNRILARERARRVSPVDEDSTEAAE